MSVRRIFVIATIALIMLVGSTTVGVAVPAAGANASASSTERAAGGGPGGGDGVAMPDGDRAGLPSVLPAPVPDHVYEVLGTIRAFLTGEIDQLGHVVSDTIAPSDTGRPASGTTGS